MANSGKYYFDFAFSAISCPCQLDAGTSSCFLVGEPSCCLEEGTFNRDGRKPFDLELPLTTEEVPCKGCTIIEIMVP